MRSISKTSLSLFVIMIASVQTGFAQGEFKVRPDQYVQIGYSSYKALTFGQSTGTLNNGNFSIEHCTSCSPGGFNIWKPWPTYGAANYLLFIRDEGNVGIGNSGDAAYKLKISGSAIASSYFVYSDRRLKTNLVSLEPSEAWNKIKNLPVYQYQYSPPRGKPLPADSLHVNVLKHEPDWVPDSDTHFGCLAQDIRSVLPELVREDESNTLSVNYIEFVPILLRALQAQDMRITELEKALSAIKER